MYCPTLASTIAILERQPLSVDDVDRAQRATLALRFLTDRRTLLISAPFSRGVMFVSQRHQTTGSARADFNFQR